jgi:hypothetical protein
MPESKPTSAVSPEDLANHYERVSNRLLGGVVVPFLGAGVNLCDRPPGFEWVPDQKDFLPKGSELADFLAKQFVYPPTRGRDLLQVSMYGELTDGRGGLYDQLDSIFRRSYPATSVHRFLAALPGPAPLARLPENHYPLIATTNYDDLMEQAFDEVGQPYDLVFFLPQEERRGSFWHQEPGKAPNPIPVGDANAYKYPFFEQRPMILKIHGTINLVNEELEGYVISEDHYIDYLAEDPLETLLPSRVVTKLRKSHLWFLGYSLSDWNFRVFLRHLHRSDRDQYRSWAVKEDVSSDEKTYWDKQGVDVFPVTLQEYIPGLRVVLLKNLPKQSTGASPR